MPSATHQNFVLLFRKHPQLVFELARRAGAPLPIRPGRLREAATEFDDPLVPGNTVRADLAIIEQVHGRPRRALALEVQLEVDLGKEWTSVLYRAALRRRHHCAAWTVIFSPDQKVREAVDKRMFRDEPELRPLVVTPEMIPVVRELDAAIADYPWAVLAAAVHADGPDAVLSATVAIQALLHLVPEDYERYIQLIAASVGEDVMQRVRAQLPQDDQEELSEWERRGSSFTRGRAEGRAEGLEQGLEQGLRAALRTVLDVRGLSVDDETEARIAACSSTDELRELVAKAATITSIAALFGR